MTLSGLIATLVALVLAVIAMRLARRSPVGRHASTAGPTRRAPPAVRTGPAPPPPLTPQNGAEGKPSPAAGGTEKAAGRSSGGSEMRPPLADTVFKIYSDEDDTKGADAKPEKKSSGKPKPRPAGSDWS